MNTKIFLQGFNSKQSVNTSEGLNVKLKGKRKLLPTTDVSEVISQNDIYKEEREKCNKIRLTCQVNPICSNVLFNDVTEIVKNEGSDKVSLLNYKVVNGVKDDNAIISENIYFKGKDNDDKIYDKVKAWVNSNKTLELTRDTQLTHDGYIYHCGKDILNNHLIRSNTFKSICPIVANQPNTSEPKMTFNTLQDEMRDSMGRRIKERVYFPPGSGYINKAKSPTKLHMYKFDDVYTFEECVENRLIKGFDGWIGFKNTAKIPTYKDFWKDDYPMEINKPIMYLNGGDFVDMYPDRSLYSFVPKYNPHRRRIEKNWNYCLTYPSSSTTMNFDDIIQTDDGINSLKALYFNENTRTDSGVKQLVIYSISKHGLSQGDYVNIYNTIKNESDDLETSIVLENAKVITVVNDFIFTVFSDVQISKEWLEVTKEDTEITIGEGENVIKYILKGTYYIKENEAELANPTKYYIIEDKYLNIDDNAQNLSYKKVVGGIECDYYIRIFSKIPNFKFASADTSNEYEIYKNDGELIEKYQSNEYDFESHVSRLAFANNIYSDDIGEIIFTDDIDISNLKDNLGRPLSSIYLTVVKNNKGYKEWYGFDKGDDWNEEMITSDSVEYSHCFGKITCGMETSEETRFDEQINSINSIANQDSNYPSGYKIFDTNSNEIDFENTKHYYGDLCYYDNYNAIERSIQPILHRFNTAQRESNTTKSNKYFNTFFYDEIKYDDYDYERKFKIEEKKIEGCNNKNEGYYYNPHYEIKIKTFGKLRTAMPDFLSVTSKKCIGTDKLQLTTLQYHNLTIGDKSMIYDKINRKYYTCVTVEDASDNYHTYTCMMYDENGNFIYPTSIKDRDIKEFKVFKLDNLGVGVCPRVLKDGTCRIIWRDVINNGFNESDDTVEEYPFTNGAFYINKMINIYVKRQDPYDYWGLYSNKDIEGYSQYVENEDNYVKDTEIEC